MILVKKLNANIDDVRIVILIVTYNSEQFIDSLLESIAAQDYDLTRVLLMVIDNNSSDKTIEKLISGLSRLDNRIVNALLIRLERNVGFAPANNIGLLLLRRVLGSLRGRKVVLLNPDTRIIDKRFLGLVDKVLNHLPLVGFATISGNNDIVDSLGAYIDCLGNTQEFLSRLRINSSIKNVILSMPLVYPVHWTLFASVAIRGDVFEHIGLLKDYYIIYVDDIEFCLRAWSHGIPVVVYRDFLVWHYRGGSTIDKVSNIKLLASRESLFKAYYFYRNLMLLIFEYLGLIPFLIRAFEWLLESMIFRRKWFVRAFVECIYLLKSKKIRYRRLPKGLVPHDPRTWVLLWALKYWLRHDGSVEEAVNYGVRRASLEYVLRYLIPRYRFKRVVDDNEPAL